MNDYLFISATMNGTDTTAINIAACDEIQALTKAYSYFGANYKLSCRDFSYIMEYKNYEERTKTFKDFTNQTILYFADVNNEEYVNELTTIDIIECI